jgi:hypothetical protein
VNRLLMKPPVIAIIGGLLCASPTLAQMLPPANKQPNVAMIQQPSLEIAYDDIAIISWVTGNPGGSDEHFGVVQYGVTPGALTQTAKSHIRLNRGHPDTTFRVRIAGLQPQTTYYYQVTSVGGDGTSDNVPSSTGQFTTPAPGQRITN